MVVKVWPLDRDSFTLKLDDLAPLMTGRTRLVCVTHVSNVLGQMHPVAEIARFVHDHCARLCVDGVAYAPHRPVDVQAWDVDYYVFSLYKNYGPHHAVMYGKFGHLLELDTLYHYFYGKDRVPGKLEPGNPSYECAYSVLAIRDYLADLGGRAGPVRPRIEAGFAAITAQEDALVARLLGWLNQRSDVRLIGPARNDGSTRIPTIAFRFPGRDSGALARAMDDHHIAIRHGDFHARRLVESLDEAGEGGLLRVSMVHYNTLDEVDRLCDAFDRILRAA